MDIVTESTRARDAVAAATRRRFVAGGANAMDAMQGDVEQPARVVERSPS